MIRRLFAMLTLATGLCLTGSAAFAQAQPIQVQPAQPVQAQPAQKSFVREDLANEAVRLEDTLRRQAGADARSRPSADWRRDAEAAITGGNARRGLSLAVNAIAADPRDWANWLAYSRAASAIDPSDYGERYQLRSRAKTAAYIAYQRAVSRQDEGRALARLGQAEAATETWRPALNAYRASLERANDPGVRTAYEEMREKHGFRITDYKVDSDSANPRVCFQFSDPLARGRIDFAPFVAVAGLTNAAVSPEGAQLCVDGLKHGERYTIALRQGLPSSVGENLLRTADYDIYVRDRSPQVRFSGRNYVLPRVGQEGIPVISVNMSKAEIDIYRIGDRSLLPTVSSDEFLSQMNRSSIKEIETEKGVKVWSGSLDVKPELNKEVVTAFPVGEAVGKLEPGVYVMVARSERPARASDNDGDYDDSSAGMQATQWFIVSDLGLTAFSGDDGTHVLVRSLASAEPLRNVEVKLVAKNNDILATTASDASGYVKFAPGLSRGAGGMAPALVVASDKSGDYGFLDLQASAFDLTDRGVKGRAAPAALDAMLFTERGVYRSGETVHITTLLRDAKGASMASLPLTLVVKRPDGVEYKRTQVADQGLGGRALSVPLLSGSQRGTWRLQAYADPKGAAIGETTFMVEDYVPERLDLTLTPKQSPLPKGAPVAVDVLARYLYGAAGSGLDVTGDVTVEAASDNPVPGLAGYAYGIEDEAFEATTAELEDKATTDAAGKASVTFELPDAATSRPLQAKVRLRVGETGGRAVERTVTVPILPAGPVLGVKKLFSELREGSTATFEVVAANPDGQKLDRPGVQWTLYRINKSYQWFNQDGRWAYEPIKSTRRILDGRADVKAGEPARLAMPVEWGTYRLDVASGEMQTSLTFTAGWSGDGTADTPDLLEVALDKDAYAAGETMKLSLKPRYAGKATVAVVSDKVQSWQTFDVKPEGTSVELKADPAWGAGAYLVALAHRPLDQAARRMPGRSLGLAWFSVDKSRHALGVNLATPEKMRPRGTLDIPVTLAGLSPGEEAYVTVSAVDLGILNLTRYQTPSPSNYFFGQRALSTELRDLYGLLIDGMQGTRGAIRSGGDAGLSGDAPTPREEPLARYSGVVKVGADGTAKVSFEIPAFNGTLRVMAAAWSKDRVGQAEKDVIVRDPVVALATLPRFMAVGDQSRFHLALDNVEGPPGDYTLDVDMHGPVSLPADATRRTIRLAAGSRSEVSIPVTAGGIGSATLDVRITGPGGIDLTQSLIARVQPGTPGLVRRTVRPLPPGGSVTLSGDLVADLIPGSGIVSASVSPFAALDVPALLAALDRYPYGCTEQTVSRAMPLLYVNKLAQEQLLALDGKAEDRVRDSIDRVLARQDSNGSFGLWSVGGNDIWLDAFVMDFLTRARERGFAVPQRAFDLALERLKNFVSNSNDLSGEKGADFAYAIYVLARNGRPVMGDLRYIADTKLGDISSGLARAQIAAALALLGDRARAERAFSSALEALRAERDNGVSRADYGSKLRDGAGFLTLAAETGMARAQILPVSTVVGESRATARYTSTQEQAWMVLAAQALSKEAENFEVTVDGEPRKGAYYQSLSGTALQAKPVTIGNPGSQAAQLVVSVQGSPLTPEPAVSQGYQVERAYYKLDGSKADVTQVKQNDRFVVVLTISEAQARYARLLLVDNLPAGFEIDNPNLVDGGSTKGLDWLKRDVEPSATEYRDDRFVAAFDRRGDKQAIFSVAYIVRAVVPGRYMHPPAVIEDMYRPDRFGRTAFGTVEVQPAR